MELRPRLGPVPVPVLFCVVTLVSFCFSLSLSPSLSNPFPAPLNVFVCVAPEIRPNNGSPFVVQVENVKALVEVEVSLAPWKHHK